MTNAIKMAEMQRANIEFERQRHLANWLIKSSAHMAKPSNSLQSSQSSQKNSISIKNGTITQNPLFFMNSSNGGQKQNGKGVHSLTKPSIFSSQTNLPLQIVTSSQDGHKPKLRKFNSHDTSANMFSVVDFENARLARRNEIERQKYKMNSLSSGGDCSTGDSKGSKLSNDSNPEPLQVNTFLERYSLPRVIRLKYDDKFNTLQSSSSNDSSLSDKKSDSKSDINGELFLLYRYLKNRKIYHGFNAKNGANKKKGIKIPQEYQGYFSLTNDRGAPTATMYSTIIQLVRERVYKFISIDNLSAYTEQTTETFPTKSHYVKNTARAGQIFRLLAVFQDGGQDNVMSGASSGTIGNIGSLSSQKDSFSATTGREKERGRYAQLLGENRQIFYVSLSVKGKFYEIEQSVPQILQRSCSLGKPQLPKKISPDCVHQISNLINTDTEFPLTLKFISGPANCGAAIPENILLTSTTEENSIVVCPIEDIEIRSPLLLKNINITSDMILTKCNLGFENEQRMFSNQNIQNLLKFCQYNTDNFIRLIEIERNEIINNHTVASSGLKMLRPLNFTKFLHRDKLISAHEKEDSIIFLSKNDLDNLEIQQQQKQLRQEEENDNNELISISDQQTITERMKVFQPNTNKKKWFKNFKNTSNKTNSFSSLDFDLEAKRRSMDRYQDMSKLLQERFGELNDGLVTNNDVNSRPSSDIGISPESRTNLTKKSISLQDVIESHKPIRVIDRGTLPETPDLIKIEKKYEKYDQYNDIKEDDDKTENRCTSSRNQQSFISEKLLNEFHVKTKNHSKSSSNLLNFSIPNKMTINETIKKDNDNQVKLQHTEIATPPSIAVATVATTTAQLSFEDDLPYSNVRDYLIIQNESQPSSPISSHAENIYAEICNDSSNHINNEMTTFGSIRISISTNDHQFQIDDKFICDSGNIYNTIK